MATFTDAKGHEWTLDFDTGIDATIRRVTEVNVLEAIGQGPSGLAKLSEPSELVGILAAMTASQWDTAMPDVPATGRHREFERRIVGDALEDGFYALLDSVADFLPSRKATRMRELIVEIKKAENLAHETVMTFLTGGAMDRAIKAEIDKATRQLHDLVAGAVSDN